MAEFREWPKTPRLFRTIVVTEKIDGTNAAIHVELIRELAPEQLHWMHFTGGCRVRSWQTGSCGVSRCRAVTA
jgi:hypothetical protein